MHGNGECGSKRSDWAGPDGSLGRHIDTEAGKTLDAYRAQPNLVAEHASIEEDTAGGGYAHRQLFELIQNSADALAPELGGRVPAAPMGQCRLGRISVRLTGNCLYCADDGAPIDADGVTALMFSRLSPKRGTNQIGTFGLGFKCVLRICDAPEFFSRAGSFRFDADRSRERIREIAPRADRWPALRLPEPIDPAAIRQRDDMLCDLMRWASNIVRLPLKCGARRDIIEQVHEFPAEFLLFVEHARTLTLSDATLGIDQVMRLDEIDGEYVLSNGDATVRWKRFERLHRLSADARADGRPGDERGEVPIAWAVPVERLVDPGKFWAFFPTHSSSLLAGILNAPWKTNEDRQYLLPGPYNDELIGTAAELVADALPGLATRDDPARHLDALPRRHEAGDSEQADLLRRRLFAILHDSAIVPDQEGDLRCRGEIAYPPKELTSTGQIDAAPFERWCRYSRRPSSWLHHTAITRIRLAAIDRLFHPEGSPPKWQLSSAPRATIAQWLESLVSDKTSNELVEASKAAVEVAALIPNEIRVRAELGRIVLTVAGKLVKPVAEWLFLPEDGLETDNAVGPTRCVHPELAADPETLSALKVLGLGPPSAESSFRLVADQIFRNPSKYARDADIHQRFWMLSRQLTSDSAFDVICQQARGRGQEVAQTLLHLRTRAGEWCPLCSVLLPGRIVTEGEGTDDGVAVDSFFHRPDLELMRRFGVTDAPGEYRNLSAEPWFPGFRRRWRNVFKQRKLRSNPQSHLLEFESCLAIGPLEVLRGLSDEAAARFTDALLSHDEIYEPWTMRHSTVDSYPVLECESPHVAMLRQHGRIRTAEGEIAQLAQALGPHPARSDGLHALLMHPNADRIKMAFGLAEPTPEFVGEEDPIPLIDVWPGLTQHLRPHRRGCRLVRCERIVVIGEEKVCIAYASDIYLSGLVGEDEGDTLRLVLRELGLVLSATAVEEVLQFQRREEVENARAAVRGCSTDAERLLAAVGEKELRAELPDSLLVALENERLGLDGMEVAEAAIATWHTDALKRHRASLERLDPPSRWAGSASAVRFVRSLGFSDAWAGERERKRDPYIEVEGPYSLPELHRYQRLIADNVRNLLRGEHADSAARRAMISMPTGSGKTRVAVQAIVEAMRDDGLVGGILWVADRDELCEQAVEAWHQVWSSKGSRASRLRISRMWEGQPRPVPANELHVVVASIQTLHARLSKQRQTYAFLADFTLVVCDEAHRSIAPTFTSVMQDIGLTRFRRVDEPFLLGLTATPYRGHDETETARLVRRYGNLRLDAGAFASDRPEHVIRELQDMKVLAYADHASIEGETFSPDTLGAEDWERMLEELDEASELPWLPQSVENRIAQSAERTRRIIEAYERYMEPHWPTLIFATSVEHAQTVAALLNRKGISSRAVSGSTETATRRRVVEEFRRGEIRALVNYGVFREGFDAPKTRAIIVARPVYSPNLYFQMIGRGLRGPRNGGDERCLILDVEDNIQSYDRALAYSDLDWLWE